MGCLFSTHMTSVGDRQHTQDVRGCLWLSVCVRECPCVFVSTHRTSKAIHQYTYQHAGPLTQKPWLFPWTVRLILAHVGCLFSTHMTSVDVCVCQSVSVSTHKKSVAVHQYTYQHVGPWTKHADPSRGLFG